MTESEEGKEGGREGGREERRAVGVGGSGVRESEGVEGCLQAGLEGKRKDEGKGDMSC